MADTEAPPLSEAYFAAVEAVVAQIGTSPLPQGLNEARVGDWTIKLNASRETISVEGTPLPPFTLVASHEVFIAFACVDPTGGVVAGASEAEFIADMKAETVPSQTDGATHA
jgi:hypothetical protein